MPPCLAQPSAAVVQRREGAQERTWYAPLLNVRRRVLVFPQQVPDPPRAGDFDTRRATWPTVLFFHPGSPWGDEFAHGRLFQAAPGAGVPVGFEQPIMANPGERPNVTRRPVSSYGDRLGVNTLV